MKSKRKPPVAVGFIVRSAVRVSRLRTLATVLELSAAQAFEVEMAIESLIAGQFPPDTEAERMDRERLR